LSAAPRTAPLLRLEAAPWFNLRALVDHSPIAALASPEDASAVGAFLDRYGVEPARDEDAEPLARLRAFLAGSSGAGPSRFSDGSFPIVYMGDAPETCLAEVAHHLGRAMSETAAAKVRTHYFLLARFTLTGEVLDVRKGFPALHRPDDWLPAQAFGRSAASRARFGITYRAVRRGGSENLGVLRGGLARGAARVKVVGLRWDGAGVQGL
jgi:hypothetical protein